MALRFHVHTYGCQMNVHDSQKVANLLHHEGMEQADDAGDADLLVINTCSIREKAEHRLYSDLGRLREWKRERPGRVLGVGGCVAQQEGDAVLRRFPHLDFVFGTHNLRLVPALVAAARDGTRATRVDETRSLDRFDLPERHPGFESGSPGRAFVTVMEGCDMFCSFCIVPRTRGREISRPANGILDEARALADAGVVELTLLGQTVNAYGRHDVRRGRTETVGTLAFAELLTALDAIPGVSRLRYTSPHPIFFDEALIRAHAELERLCPHVHLPLQSGSDRVLERMRRRYTADDFRRLADRLHAARPDLVLTSDLIVGFPGETEADFEHTLAVVRDVDLVDAYTFKYSPRPGTAAEDLPDSVAPEVAQERLERLQSQVRDQTLAYHRGRVGGTTEVLLLGASRRDTGALSGRDPQHRVVNLAAPPSGDAAPGTLLPVEIVDATPHSLIGLARPSAGPEDSLRDGLRLADEPRRMPAVA